MLWVYNDINMQEALDEHTIEEACKQQFGLSITVADIIAHDVSVGQTARATVFKTGTGQVYAFIASRGSQLFGDVQKSILRMQCEAEAYYPPHGEKEYFERIAREKFKMLFPGKHIVGDDDIRYYKGLAPYNPALVRLSKVKGEIRAYDDHLKAWRKVKDFSYSRIATI